MLPLNSDRWANLEHAYGIAEDLPEMIRRISTEGLDAIIDLFGTICHQRSTYSASYAAVPHLLRLAQLAESVEVRAELLILIGSIRASLDYRGAPAPSDVVRAYLESLPGALDEATVTLPAVQDAGMAIYLLQAAVALHDGGVLGRELNRFADGEFAGCCPWCASDLYLWPSPDGGLEVAVAHRERSTAWQERRTRVTPGPSAGFRDQLVWLQLVASTAPVLEELVPLLPSLFGEVPCPKCNTRLDVLEALE